MRLLLALVLVTVHAPLRAQQPAPELSTFLEKTIGFNAKQLASLERGQPVVKELRTSVDRDVAMFGIVSVDVSRAWFVEHFTAVGEAFHSPSRSRFGLFGTPATASDVGELALSPSDVADLKKCKPGSCNFKLPAAGMAFMSTRVDWTAANVAGDLQQLAREQMATYVNDYRLHGSAAMVVYDDAAHGVKSSDALAGLLGDSPYLYPSVPAFPRYLLNYPAEKLDSVTNVIFWSQDQMPRTRPILGIGQLSTYSPADPGNVTFIGTKQLWADHYLEASVDILSVVDRPASAGHEGSGIYLIVLRQFRFDHLPNYPLFSIRNRVANGLRDQADSDLRRIKQSYEQGARAPESRKPF